MPKIVTKHFCFPIPLFKTTASPQLHFQFQSKFPEADAQLRGKDHSPRSINCSYDKGKNIVTPVARTMRTLPKIWSGESRGAVVKTKQVRKSTLSTFSLNGQSCRCSGPSS